MSIQQVLIAILVIAGGTFSSFAAQTVRLITTLKGKTYEECRIFKVDPDGVMFSHKHGGAKILFTDMTVDSRNQFGYDPEKLAEYNKGIAEKNQKERELVAEYRKELLKAQAAAAEYARWQTMMQPTYQPAYTSWNDGSLVTPYVYEGFGGAFYNAWAPINRHAGYRGQYGKSSLPGSSSDYHHGNSPVFKTINVGRYYPAQRCNTPQYSYGTPALRTLAPALGVRPMGVASAGRR